MSDGIEAIETIRTIRWLNFFSVLWCEKSVLCSLQKMSVPSVHSFLLSILSTRKYKKSVHHFQKNQNHSESKMQVKKVCSNFERNERSENGVIGRHTHTRRRGKN